MNHLVPCGGNRVNLVDQNHAGSKASGALENLPDVGLALTDPHGQDLWTIDDFKVGLGLPGYGLCDQGLTIAGRPVKEYTVVRLHAQFVVVLRMLKWQTDDMFNLAECRVLRSDVGVPN